MYCNLWEVMEDEQAGYPVCVCVQPELFSSQDVLH